MFNCKECTHYGFYEMITSGSYGYSGKIPCQTCLRFLTQQDNFEPIKAGDLPWKEPRKLWKKKPKLR